MQTVTAILSSPWFLIVWAATMLPCLIWTIRDLRGPNAHLMPLMKVVWALTVVYSSVVGLMIYRWSGRKQITGDGIWRRGARSVAHCYSGCGMGEITGLIIAVGLLSLSTLWVALVTFAFAYAAGFALTMGPLMQDGVPFGEALKDTALSETPSIFVMEVVAIGVDIWLSGDATLGDIRFWSSLVVSLTCGLIAAYPLNVALVRFGVKEGMMDPRKTSH
jgi:hypothetical protein